MRERPVQSQYGKDNVRNHQTQEDETPYQMENNAAKDSVDGKVDASLHALKSGKVIVLQHALLEPT
jgi:hypothetical protein